MTGDARSSTVVHPSGVIPQALVDKVIARRGERLHMYPRLDGPRTAVVVVDMDQGSCRRMKQLGALVEAVNAVAEAVRAAGGCVAFVTSCIESPQILEASLGTDLAADYFAETRPGGIGTQLVAELDVHPDDLQAVKKRASAFFPGNCDLSDQLRARGAEFVLIAGLMTNVCCESSARDAYKLGYRITVVSDAVVGQSFGLHEASLATIFRYFGDVRPTHEVIDLLRRPRTVADGLVRLGRTRRSPSR